MHPTLRTLPLVLVSLFAAACGDGDQKPDTVKPTGGGDKPAAGGGEKAAAYEKAKGTASVKITVKFAGGAAPASEMYSMSSADVCATHNGKVRREKSEVNADGSVPHAFVWATAGEAVKLTGFEVPGAARMDQTNCAFVPHVLGLQVKQAVKIKNNDPTTHNVRIKPSKQDGHNISQSQGKEDEISFAKAEEAIEVGCDVHTWMGAKLFVLKHPFHGATTRDSGTVTISGLYPGKYTFKVWHENWSKAGAEKSVEVEVKDGETKDATVELGK